ncbi:MAG: hypothetical protein COC05_00025 [Gammaproteobacteria bacterium]|nr:MAG: hypothetical protein COC05_00025 [Gammaproteobacteria bacterium]
MIGVHLEATGKLVLILKIREIPINAGVTFTNDEVLQIGGAASQGLTPVSVQSILEDGSRNTFDFWLVRYVRLIVARWAN